MLQAPFLFFTIGWVLFVSNNWTFQQTRLLSLLTECCTSLKELLHLASNSLLCISNIPPLSLLFSSISHSAFNQISVLIPKAAGDEIAAYFENGSKVFVHLSVGPSTSQRYANINRTSVLFVSVSFIILMIISLAWLIFYYVQRFRYIHAKDILAVSNR